MISFRTALIAVLLAAGLSAPALAECTFGWQPGEGVPGTNWKAKAAVVWDDGTGPALYVAGNFNVAGNVLANHIAKWDGRSWQPLGSGIDTTSGGVHDVYALAVYNGQLIAGGYFARAGGVSAKNIAAWNGVSWKPLGTGLAGSPQALTVYEGRLIAGGGFTGGVAAWDGSSWQTLGSEGRSVSALAVYNGTLVAAGSMLIGNCVAAWNGTSWQPLGGAMSSGIRALTVYNGQLIAGGDFSSIGGVSARRIAAWDGASWQPLGSGIDFGQVWALAVDNGRLIAAGWFDTAGGVAATNIASWDGTAWQPLGSGVGGGTSLDSPYPYTYAIALTVYDDQLITLGAFTTAGGGAASNVAAWNGESWQALGSGINDQVSALGVYNGSLIASGRFTSVPGANATHIAGWNGVSWSPLGPGLDAAARAMTTYKGELIAGGSFTTAGGAGANHIAAWDGAAWHPLGSGMDNSVYALTLYDGQLVAGGYFTTAGDVTVNGIALWDGASWQPLGSGFGGTYPEAYALAVYNGRLIAGGWFTTAGGVTANYIAAWDGASWRPLGSGMDKGVSALAVYNGQLIAVGSFSTAGGVSAKGIAAWNGSTWRAVSGTPSGLAYATVYNDQLFATSQTGLYAWDGVSWRSLGTVSGYPGDYTSDPRPSTAALTVYDGQLIVSGFFTIAGGQASAYLASWGPTTPPAAITQQPQSQSDVCPGANVQFSVSASGTEPLTYRWQKDGSDLVEDGHCTGVSTPVLTILAAAAGDAGQYRCVVSNDCGAATSEPAGLTLNPDSDSDGLADCLDACPASDPAPTLAIGDCDTGVPNRLLGATGCKMSDAITQAAAAARNHGAFTSAVADLSNNWAKAGLITGAQKGQIQRCAAQAKTPPPPGKDKGK